MDFAAKLMERTGKGYLSYSALKYAADGGKQQDMKLFEMYMRGLLKKESEAFEFGHIYEMMLETPEEVANHYYVIYEDQILQEIGGKNPRATNKYKEWLESEKEYAEGKGLKVIPEEDIKRAEDMIIRLDESEVVDPLTGEIRSVRSYLIGKKQYEINGWIRDIPVKGFLDNRGSNFISDIKTTRSVHGFHYDVRSLDYDIQAYIYTEYEQIPDFYWVVQEKSVPHLCGVFKASEITIGVGGEKFWSAVTNIRKWLNSPTKETGSFALYGTI
jgi:hypothetical protein